MKDCCFLKVLKRQPTCNKSRTFLHPWNKTRKLVVSFTPFSHSAWARQLSRYSDWLWAGRSGDRIPVGGEIFRTCPDRTWNPPSLLYNGYRDFPGGKERPGRDADPSPRSSAVGIQRVKRYLYYPYVPYGQYNCALYLYLYHIAPCV
jgi:hypothetical protein